MGATPKQKLQQTRQRIQLDFHVLRSLNWEHPWPCRCSVAIVSVDRNLPVHLKDWFCGYSILRQSFVSWVLISRSVHTVCNWGPNSSGIRSRVKMHTVVYIWPRLPFLFHTSSRGAGKNQIILTYTQGQFVKLAYSLFKATRGQQKTVATNFKKPPDRESSTAHGGKNQCVKISGYLYSGMGNPVIKLLANVGKD